LTLREADKTVKIPSAIDLHKRLVASVKPLHPWYYESSKASPQQALTELRAAWDRCFKKVFKQPKFKKKGVSGDSFYKEQGTKAKPEINNDGKRVKLPNIGWVRLHEPLPITAVHNCAISRKAERWFIAFKYEIEHLLSLTLRQPQIDKNKKVNITYLIKSQGNWGENINFSICFNISILRC
jgi:putative transposase